MINKGASLEEIKRLFEYLEQSKTDNKMQVIMTNDMCKSLYDIYITMYEYQKIVKNRIDETIELLKKYNDKENNYYVPVDKCIDILKGDDKE